MASLPPSPRDPPRLVSLLDSSDVHALAQTQRVLLSPLDHASTQTWAEAASGALQSLFHADRALVTVGGAGPAALVSVGVGDRDLQDYEDTFAGRDRAGDLVTALPQPYYVEEDFELALDFEAHLESEAYNEWYRPLGLTQALGMLVLGERGWVPDLYDSIEAPVVANVLLAGSPMSSGPEAKRARMLLAMLQPAFAASVATVQHIDRAILQTGSQLDRAGVITWLYDEMGQILLESANASRLAATVHEGAQGLAQRVFESLTCGQPAMPTRTVTSGSRRFLLQASALEPGGRRSAAVLVTARAETVPEAEELRRRFRLTERQAEVARLLALRRTNGEIAEALFISPHTARGHTEAVFRELDVSTRRDVADALSQTLPS